MNPLSQDLQSLAAECQHHADAMLYGPDRQWVLSIKGFCLFYARRAKHLERRLEVIIEMAQNPPAPQPQAVVTDEPRVAYPDPDRFAMYTPAGNKAMVEAMDRVHAFIARDFNIPRQAILDAILCEMNAVGVVYAGTFDTVVREAVCAEFDVIFDKLGYDRLDTGELVSY